MGNICLIGGSGFVGTRLIELIQQNREYEILNIDKNNSNFYPEITIIRDIRDKEKLKKLLHKQDIVILLAAEHRDDISPISLYYDVNVEGTRNVLEAMDECSIKKIIFTSSVAVYGLNKQNPNEESAIDPFNHYGKSKLQAEELLRNWYEVDKESKMLAIIRPTVIFGERNRGNVYNLLKQIASGRFLKVGNCNNKKSMAYVGNIIAFIHFILKEKQTGYHLYNYIDKPDLTMNELIGIVCDSLEKKLPSVKVPYSIGMLGGYGFDILTKITKKKFPISSVRVKKFCASTQFDASKAHSSGFKPPYKLTDALKQTIQFEFTDHSQKDDIIFISE